MVSFVLGNLVLNVVRMRRKTASVVVSGDIGIDSRNKRSGPLAGGLGLALLQLLPFTPILEPCLVVFAHVQVDIQTPAHGLYPIKLKRVEFRHGNAANLRPGAVLECVIIQELATQEQRYGQVSPNLSLRSLVWSLGLHRVDPLGKVVHAKKNGCARQSRRSEDLRNKLAESRSDRRVGSHHSNRHLSNILCHSLDLIVEDGTHASGHFEGRGRESDEDRKDLCRRRGL